METGLTEIQSVRIDKQIAVPLTQVFKDTTLSPSNFQKLSIANSQSFAESLNELFPEQEHYDKDIKRAKEMLKTIAWDLTPEQLKDIVTEVQYLCESWLDDFERSIFKGQTLKELLHEKGGK